MILVKGSLSAVVAEFVKLARSTKNTLGGTTNHTNHTNRDYPIAKNPDAQSRRQGGRNDRAKMRGHKTIAWLWDQGFTRQAAKAQRNDIWCLISFLPAFFAPLRLGAFA
jgi:hypothetical protein